MKIKNTVIKNIYYMLTYAFRILIQKNYETVASESFDNIYNLFAAILIKGVNKQVKQGLYKEYINRQDDLPTIRGKINIKNTIENQIQRKRLITCEYDELTENNIFNQIIKTTIILLLREKSVQEKYKIQLRKILAHFSNVSLIDHKEISWKTLAYQRNNETYKMLMNICYFIIRNLLLTTQKGEYKSPVFSEENTNLLFERFVFNYYQKHFSELKVHAPYIQWSTEEDYSGRDDMFLPRMETDIVLQFKKKKLIIDTKFYSEPMTSNDKLNSNNLYQIFSYVKNMQKNNDETVSGLLLYAQTEQGINPDFSYKIDGNKISAQTLNLDQNFEQIKKQLDQIVDDFLYFDVDKQ